MKQPWLVQRCILEEGKLRYEYMGSAEFESDDQGKALKRIFVAGIDVGLTKVVLGGKEIPVYMFAPRGFLFADYQPYLQQLAENKLRLKERTNFDDAAKLAAGLPMDSDHIPETNVWFDFDNDVLWTLTEDNQKALVTILEGIKKSWAKAK
jgi:hypothetical protein